MSCNLKLVIPSSKINDIQKELSKKYEISGVIMCNEKNEISINTSYNYKDLVGPCSR